CKGLGQRQGVGEPPGIVACSDDEARGKYSRRPRLEPTHTGIIEQIPLARNIRAQLLLQSGQRSRALGGRLEPLCRRAGPSVARRFFRDRRLPGDPGCRRSPAPPTRALRNNIAGGIPDRQLTENLTVVFADHRSYLPAFRKTSTSAKATKAIVVARRATMAVTDEISLFAAIKVSNFLLPTNAKVTHPQLGDCRPTFSCGGVFLARAPCARCRPFLSRAL